MYGGDAPPYGQHQQQQHPPLASSRDHMQQQPPPNAGYGYPPANQAPATAPLAYAPYSDAPPPYAIPNGGYPSGGGGDAYDHHHQHHHPPAGGYGRPDMERRRDDRAWLPPHHQHHHHDHHDHHGDGEGRGRGGEGRFSAVRLRGLPFGVREYDVAVFLGLDPIDILLIQRMGRFSGEAIAVLAHSAEMDAALRRNKAYMGARYIEVFEARKPDYYRAIAEVVNEAHRRSLPPPPSHHHQQNHEGSSYREDRRTSSERGGDGGGGGGGYYGGRGGGGGGRSRSRSPLPTRGGGVRERDREEKGEEKERNGSEEAATAAAAAEDEAPPPLFVASKILKLRGLPFSATAEDIVEFFGDPALGLSTVPGVEDVMVGVAADGRTTGIAFVEFSSADVAEVAMRKDRQMMGSRYIEMFVSSEEDRGRHLPVGP